MSRGGNSDADSCACPGVSEAPDDAGGSAVVILSCAEVAGMHVIALHPPGKVFEENFVVRTAADVDHHRVIDEAARVQMSNAGHAVHKGAPLPEGGRQARPGNRVVLRDVAGIPLTVKTAAIDHDTEVQ